MAGTIRPDSRGALRLASADPEATLLLDPACLQRDDDVAALAAADRAVPRDRRAARPGQWRREELYPGPAVRDRRELRDYMRRTAITYHHQVGTCKMGVDELAVVDPELASTGSRGCGWRTPR